MLIYKIFRDQEWSQLQADGTTKGAPIDLIDGYIHISAVDQVAETAAKHFVGEQNLWLIALEADNLDPLKWEVSRGGAKFPHLFRDLALNDVVWAKQLPLVDGKHVFPAEMV